MHQTANLFIDEIKVIKSDVYRCAVEHGWWETDRNFGELLALIHSEVTEAYQHVYHGVEVSTIYEKDGKQEGVVVDIADVVIRVLDIAGRYNFEVGNSFLKDYNVSGHDVVRDLLELHVTISCVLEASRTNGVRSEAVETLLDEVTAHCLEFAEAWHLDLYNAVKNKAAFNWTRPYKHGKLF